MRHWPSAILYALIILCIPYVSFGQNTGAVRPPFRLDQIVTQPSHAFLCNPAGGTAALQSCTLASYFNFSGTSVSIDLAAFGALRSITTTAPLTGGGDLSTNRTLSIQGNGIDNSLLAAMAAHTFKGNNTGISATALDLTATQVTAEMNPCSSVLKGMVPTPPNDATKYLDGTCAFSTPAISSSSFNNPTITGGTMTGTIITGLTTPVNAGDAATKQYVDGIGTAARWHQNVSVASAAALPNSPSYSNGSSGVGATLTAGANAALVVDGVTVSTLGTRVLAKNQAAGAQNGIYTLTQAGTGGVPWILTRATDFDVAVDGEIAASAFVFVGAGTLAGNSWVLITPSPITVGTTSLDWTQSGGTTNLVAGGGLNVTGNIISLIAPVTGVNGGTGVANSGKTITLGGNLTTSGAFAATLTMTGTTGVTFPTTGTLLSTASIITCNGSSFLQSGAGAFACATVPTQQNITLGPGFTIARGTDNAGPLVPGTNTLYKQDFPKDITANTTIDISHIDYTLNANGTATRTFTLPAATTSTNVVGSKGNGFCIADKSGFGFTISAPATMYGMAGVSSTSFTFSPNSFVCPSSDGVTWKLTGLHGTIPLSQFPIIANGHVLGNASGGSATAGDVTLVAGSNMTIAASGGNITFSSTGGGGSGTGIDTAATALTAVGTGQSNCLALTAQQSRITTAVATSSPYNAVCLPPPAVGGHAFVINRTSNPIQACPTTGVQINSLTVTSGCIQINAGMTAQFISQTTSAWDSVF